MAGDSENQVKSIYSKFYNLFSNLLIPTSANPRPKIVTQADSFEPLFTKRDQLYAAEFNEFDCYVQFFDFTFTQLVIKQPITSQKANCLAVVEELWSILPENIALYIYLFDKLKSKDFDQLRLRKGLFRNSHGNTNTWKKIVHSFQEKLLEFAQKLFQEEKYEHLESNK